jgi:hypothetical protein
MGCHCFFGKHPGQNFLECHGVAACFPGREEVTGAVPLVIVFPAEIHREIGNGDTVFLLGVSFGFFDFPNQA